MTNWVTHYEIAAIVLLMAIIVMFYSGDRVSSKASIIFRAITISVLLTAIVDVISVYTLANKDIVPTWVSYILVVMYNVGITVNMWLYVHYVVHITRFERNSGRKLIFKLGIPIIAELILIITSPFTHFVFYIDEAGTYHRGSGMAQWFVVVGLYTLCAGYLCLSRRRFLSRMERVAIFLWTGSLIVCQLLQLVLPGYLLNSFGCALGVFFVYISIQGDFIDTDKILGTYSNDALAKKISYEIDNGKTFDIVAIRLGGFDEINIIYGYKVAEDVLHQLAEFLSKSIPKHQVFYTTGPVFACYIEGGREVARRYAEMINQKLSSGIYSTEEKNRISVPYGITIVSCPEQADTPQRYNAVVNMVLKEPTLSNDRIMVPVTDEIIKQYDRRIEVERAVERAVRSGAFEVCYQPIIDIEKGKVHSAEALIRLRDDKNGVILPDEFIPIAEENGAIIQITNFVLSAVCRFIKENDIRKKGLAYIEVNLSAVECVRPDTANRLLALIESYGIEKSLINFEITETAAVGHNPIIRHNLDRLIDAGVSFSLDDYGTGYSNMTELLELPLEIAKVDRSLLWLALDSKEAMCVLNNATGMLRSLGREIVVEGVENVEHEQMLRELGIRYAQGFAYSKALDAENFIEYATNVNLYGMTVYSSL